MSTNPCESDLFRRVCDLENPLMAIKEISYALMLLSDALTGDGSRAVNRLAIIINGHVEDAENVHSDLWNITHPSGDTREVDE